jgi:hypothetical protein
MKRGEGARVSVGACLFVRSASLTQQDADMIRRVGE